MADFEGLIRQALARQNADDPAVRERIYQSSRNALARMLASAGARSPEVLNAQRVALENSIARIEAGFAPKPAPRAAPRPAAAPPPVDWRAENPAARREPELAGSDAPEEPGDLDYAPGEDAAEFEDFDSSDSPALRRSSRGGGRMVAVIAVVAVVALLGWLAYSLVTSLLANPDRIVAGSRPAASDPAETAAVEDASYITVLSPADTGGLDTSGRGKAEIVNQGGNDMIRLTSVRPDGQRADPAKPILVAIGDGALEQIAGRRVTVEIQAKSGGNGPATFAIGCEFGGEDACGRKRFRVGLQPEAIVFTMEVPQALANGGEAFLTISTDVTSAASLSGNGDPIDIVSARLRYQED